MLLAETSLKDEIEKRLQQKMPVDEWQSGDFEYVGSGYMDDCRRGRHHADQLCGQEALPCISACEWCHLQGALGGEPRRRRRIVKAGKANQARPAFHCASGSEET